MDCGDDRYWKQTYHTSSPFLVEEYVPQHTQVPQSTPARLRDHHYRFSSSSSEQVQYTTIQPNYNRPCDYQCEPATQVRPAASVLAPAMQHPDKEKQLQLRQKKIAPLSPSIAGSSTVPMLHEGTSWINTNPPPYSAQASLPIAVPQMSKGRGVPFQRLYAPALQEYGISESAFVEFIDRLNVVSAASPPLKVLDLAGGLVGMVPHHWAQLASSLIQLTAKGGTAILSKNRTETFLSEANENIFSPRRLRARLVTSDALLTTINFPREKLIALPLNTAVPLEQQPAFHSRLLQGLHGYVSETFSTSLPPVGDENNMLDKLSANQVSRDIKAIDKKLMKQSQKQIKHEIKDQDATYQADDFNANGTHLRRSKSFERKTRKIYKEAQKKLDSGKIPAARVEEERNEKLSKLMDKRDHKTKHGRDKKDREKSKTSADEKFMQKLLWIFIDRLPDVSA